LLHALESFAAQTVDTLHAWRWQDPFHRMETVLQLLLYWLHFLLERVVSTGERVHANDLLLRHLHVLLLHLLATHLLLVVLDESRLHHVDAVLALDLIAVVE